MMKQLWQCFWRPSAKVAWGLIFVVGVGTGAIMLAGFHSVMEYTNTLEFCISCHDMEQTVYQEYKDSIHYSNPSGVRAICSDCHVPKPFAAKLWRKIIASREIYHKIVGTIDTPEKFALHRLEMAERVWDDMLKNDSRECRTCHSYHAMDFPNQRQRSREKMQPAMQEGKTCIECHKGIAHKRPYSDEELDD